jgi:hypothetical protein
MFAIVSPKPAVPVNVRLTLLNRPLVVVQVARPPKQLEEVDQFFARDSESLIFDLEHEHIGVDCVRGESDGDRLKLWCIFHGIYKEMQEDLLQPLLVRAHALGDIRALLQVDDDVFAVCVEVDQVQELLEEIVDVEGLLFKHKLVRLDAQVVLRFATPLTRTLLTKLWMKRALVNAASR